MDSSDEAEYRTHSRRRRSSEPASRHADPLGNATCEHSARSSPPAAHPARRPAHTTHRHVGNTHTHRNPTDDADRYRHEMRAALQRAPLTVRDDFATRPSRRLFEMSIAWAIAHLRLHVHVAFSAPSRDCQLALRWRDLRYRRAHRRDGPLHRPWSRGRSGRPCSRRPRG